MRKMVSDLRSQANSEQNEPNLFLRVSSPLRGGTNHDQREVFSRDLKVSHQNQRELNPFLVL